MMKTCPTSLTGFARTSRRSRGDNSASAPAFARARTNGFGNVHANPPLAMRNSGLTHGAESKTTSAVHPFNLLAARSVGRVARITRVHGARGLELAEKAGPGWRRRRAFTRVELCAGLAAVALLGLLALPALASAQSRGHTAQCLNNLRLMGRAVQMWASDFQGQAPWRTRVEDGGLQPGAGSRPGNAWFEFAFMSNQLVTPRILACPSDAEALVATEFSANLSGGYFSAGFRNFATSYMLNMDSFAEYPGGFLFGDRNVRMPPSASSCSAGINNVLNFYTSPGSDNGWSNHLHGLSGNIVVFDGSVSHTSTEQLSAAMKKSKAIRLE